MASLIGLTALAGLVCQVNAQTFTDGRGFPDCQNGPLKNNTVCDTSADPSVRATALITLFTLEEKLNNTGSTSPGVPRLGLPAYTWWSEGLHGVADSPGVDFATTGNFRYPSCPIYMP